MSAIKSLGISVLLIALVTEETNGCHNAYHGGYVARKKRSVAETLTSTSYETYEYNSTALVEYFTNCMIETSEISFDWYSATEWTVIESNWFYFTDNVDCASEGPDNETDCWLLNVDDFFQENIQPTVKNCIKQYAIDYNFTYSESLVSSSSARKKRSLKTDYFPMLSSPGLLSIDLSRDGDSFINSAPKPYPYPTSSKGNTECPPTIPSDYNTELQRLLPPSLLKPQEGYQLNITNVITFVDLYTVCTECERYSGEQPVDCFANRLDLLTRSDSRIKQAVQIANARFANGGSTVGDCGGSVYQTEWFDIDNPSEDDGDDESLLAIRNLFPNQVCSNPTGIQAELSDTKEPYGRGNDVLVISPHVGLICINAVQASGQCKNYRVRFCCKDYVGKCPLRFGWTPFFDESDPTNNGEFERLHAIRQANRGKVCSNPAAIGARLTSNLPYQLTGDVLQIEPLTGLTCFTKVQPDEKCGDYKVRFCCPSIIGKCAHGHKWTKWYDTKVTKEGDNESVQKLQKQQDWQCVGNPSAIEAQESKSRRPYIEPGNRFKFVNPRQGLQCLTSVQDFGTRCRNYRVRFCCQHTPPPTVRVPSSPPTPRTARQQFSYIHNRGIRRRS